MGVRPSGRGARRTLSELEPDDGRGWLSHGLAALAISVLGLAVAGSISLGTSAEPASGSTVVRHQTSVPASAPLTDRSTGPTRSRAAAPAPPVAPGGNLQAFARRTAPAAPSDGVRLAVVRERAAQRSEDLSKTAQDVTRSAQAEGSKARQSDLMALNRSTRETAVRLAQERLRRAIAARVAATVQRERAEAAQAAQAGTPAAANTPPGQSQNQLPLGSGAASPVPGAVIGAAFGQYGSWSRYHTGLDFRAGYGTPIRAVRAGVVLFAGNSGDWAGNHVAVRHADGMTTMSSHMSSMAVSSGQSVQAGQVIGYVGSTGRSFGAHLHFELYPNGVRYGDVYRAINPVPWLRANGVTTR